MTLMLTCIMLLVLVTASNRACDFRTSCQKYFGSILIETDQKDFIYPGPGERDMNHPSGTLLPHIADSSLV